MHEPVLITLADAVQGAVMILENAYIAAVAVRRTRWVVQLIPPGVTGRSCKRKR